ncbi:MAG: polysulfide reductase NrfD [Deltaproteobacteria bacterium]|nr:polysulfide reductase NrfD [Deltaproteobacteria bacterium]
MESQVIMNVFHHATWGEPIAIYFFLMGVSAGAHVISAFGWVFGINRYKPIGLFANIFSIIVLLIIPPFLIADLGKPFRFFYLLLPGYWHGTAPMSWGTIFLILYTTFMVIYAIFIYKHNAKWARVFGLLAMTFAASTHWYTGVVIQLNPTRGLNHTATASLLFLTGAFISGTGMLIVLFWLKNLVRFGKPVDNELIIELGKVMMFGIAFEILLTFNEYLQLTYGTDDEFVYLKYILLGVMRTYYFWLNVVALVASFIILAFTPFRKTVGGVLLACFLVIAAIWGMRHWWVYGGQYLQTFF